MSESKPDPAEKQKVRLEAQEVPYANVDYSKASVGRFYTNHVAGSSSLFDIRLILSDVDVVGAGIVASQVLTVLMTPEVAYLTHKLLGELLERYQKSNGELRLPKGAALRQVAQPKIGQSEPDKP